MNAVVDSYDLRVSVNKRPSPWLLDRAKAWREHKEKFRADPKNTESLTETIPQLGTFTLRFGRSPYEFRLSNPELCDLDIWKPEKWEGAIGGQTGQFYINFRSHFLQFHGFEAAMAFAQRVIDWFCGEPMRIGPREIDNLEFIRISRVDLAADIQMPRNLTYSDLDFYSCRSRKRDVFLEPFSDALQREFEKGSKAADGERHPLLDNKGGDTYTRNMAQAFGVSPRQFLAIGELFLRASGVDPNPGTLSRIVATGSGEIQTVYFGRFASELYARQYDKLASLERQNKGYMREVWKAGGWDGVSPVWRVEFSMSGDFLRHGEIEGQPIDLRDPALFQAAIPRLWAYLTDDWLRHCELSEDTNKSRWQTSELWKVVQGAWEPETPIKRAKPEPKPDDERLYQQIRGCAISALAMIGSPRYQRGRRKASYDPEAHSAFLLDKLRLDFATSETRQEVESRRKHFGLDFTSDTAWSSLIRSEQMQLGTGS